MTMSKVSKKLVLNRNTVVNLSFKSGLKTGGVGLNNPYATRGQSVCATITQGLPVPGVPDAPTVIEPGPAATRSANL